MLMDNLVIIASSRAELHGMLGVAFDWCWRSRLSVNLLKAHVFVRAAVGVAAERRV